LRCATMRRSRRATTPGHARVGAKVVVSKVQSNYNNVVANRLRVVEDTTDVAARGPGPVPVRDVADADRTFFVGKWGYAVWLEGTNEVADVSVIEASDQVWSCLCTHGCVSLPVTLFTSDEAPTAVLLLAAPLPVASLFASAISPMAVF
jgi:hypothetical protein